MDKLWDRRLVEITEFRVLNSRLPFYNTAKYSQAETVRAIWLNRQKMLARRRELTAHRADRLQKILPELTERFSPR